MKVWKKVPCYRLKTSKLIFDIRNDNLDYGDKMSASGNRNQSGIMLTKFQGFWNSRMSNGRRISPLAIILLIALIFYSLMILKRIRKQQNISSQSKSSAKLSLPFLSLFFNKLEILLSPNSRAHYSLLAHICRFVKKKKVHIKQCLGRPPE